jgi:hypothetical protein
MFDDLRREYSAAIQYELCEVFFDIFLANLSGDVSSTIRDMVRTAEASGRCVYKMKVGELGYGNVYMRRSFGKYTHITTEIHGYADNTQALLNRLENLLGQFWGFCESQKEADRDARPLNTIASSEKMYTALDRLRPKRTRKTNELKQPRPDAPITEWLNWRQEERKRGRKRTLDYIAENSIHSRSTIGKESAEYSSKGTKRTK